jgi:hypothetical protein
MRYLVTLASFLLILAPGLAKAMSDSEMQRKGACISHNIFKPADAPKLDCSLEAIALRDEEKRS